jgi:tRNA1(Val) A37 N6-methylase TrmN6
LKRAAALPDRNDDLTEDRLLGGRVRLSQPTTGYRAGIDPVFLAAAVPAKAGERVLDVGAGAGAAALCLAARVAKTSVSGVEADRALVRLANANAGATGVGDRVQFFAGDLLTPPVRLAPASFDHVMANPPYMPEGAGRASPDPGKAAATVEDRAGLGDWLRFCLLMAAPTGTVTLIHRADRLDALLEAIAGRLGGVVVFPLWPGGEGRKAAKRVIVSGRKGSRAPLSLVPGLVLHHSGGAFTDEAEAVLRHAGALQLDETRRAAP